MFFFQVRAIKEFSSKGKTLSVSLSFEGDFYLNLLCNEGKGMNVKKEIWLWSLSLQVPTMSPEWCQTPKFEIPPPTSFFIFHFLFQTPVCPFVNGEFWSGGGPTSRGGFPSILSPQKRWKIWREKKNAFSTTQKFYFGIIVSRIFEEDRCRLIPHKWFLINISGSEIMKNIFLLHLDPWGAMKLPLFGRQQRRSISQIKIKRWKNKKTSRFFSSFLPSPTADKKMEASPLLPPPPSFCLLRMSFISSSLCHCKKS